MSRRNAMQLSSSSSSANNSQQQQQQQPPMKVVYIKTQYIETDAVSFKSVVQNLTGMNSAAAGAPTTEHAAMREKVDNSSKDNYLSGGSAAGNHHSFLTRDFSGREFDRLLKELPSFDELHKLLTFD